MDLLETSEQNIKHSYNISVRAKQLKQITWSTQTQKLPGGRKKHTETYLKSFHHPKKTKEGNCVKINKKPKKRKTNKITTIGSSSFSPFHLHQLWASLFYPTKRLRECWAQHLRCLGNLKPNGVVIPFFFFFFFFFRVVLYIFFLHVYSTKTPSTSTSSPVVPGKHMSKNLFVYGDQECSNQLYLQSDPTKNEIPISDNQLHKNDKHKTNMSKFSSRP